MFIIQRNLSAPLMLTSGATKKAITSEYCTNALDFISPGSSFKRLCTKRLIQICWSGSSTKIMSLQQLGFLRQIKSVLNLVLINKAWCYVTCTDLGKSAHWSANAWHGAKHSHLFAHCVGNRDLITAGHSITSQICMLKTHLLYTFVSLKMHGEKQVNEVHWYHYGKPTVNVAQSEIYPKRQVHLCE